MAVTIREIEVPKSFYNPSKGILRDKLSKKSLTIWCPDLTKLLKLKLLCEIQACETVHIVFL